MAETNDQSPNAAETQEVKGSPPGLPPTWWTEYVGKPVALQLRDGLSYYGVTHPNDFIIHPEQKVPVAVPLLKGLLQRAVVDIDGVRLILQTTDPDRNKPRSKMYIVIHPGDVQFATFSEMDLIA